MVELLAGPFAVVDSDLDAVDIADAYLTSTAFYDDRIGIGSYSLALGGYTVTQMDGMTHLRSRESRANAYAMDLRTAGGGWMQVDSLFYDAIYEWSAKTGTKGEAFDTGSTNDFFYIHALCADRYINVTTNHVRFRPLDLSASWVNECTLTGAGTGQVSLSRTRTANVVALAYTSGHVVFYNHATKTQAAGSAFVGTNSGAWYSAKHDVFIVLTGTSTNSVYVYANKPAPSALSAPVAAPSLRVGGTSRITVRLTGAHGEGCAGELVDWTLTGDGELLATQSTTDADGYATVRYVAPMSPAADPLFEASVTF